MKVTLQRYEITEAGIYRVVVDARDPENGDLPEFVLINPEQSPKYLTRVEVEALRDALTTALALADEMTRTNTAANS